MYYVYVLASDGTPLMPTRKFGKVRRLLNSGKAVVAYSKPFTIRLTYEPETHILQDTVLGIDPGRTNIGLDVVREDGTSLYSANCKTRNEEIPDLMRDRKMHRQASRRGERMARKRLAKRLGTTVKKVMERVLPGYGKPVIVKDIINTEARFNNRKRPDGWLTPTATQLLRTHENLIEEVKKILPVTDIAIEINSFSFMELDNGGKLRPWEYQRGSMYGFKDEFEALTKQQEGKCLLCGKEKIEHIHHIVPRSRGGSDTLANKAGLCIKCHELVHKDAKSTKTLESKKAGIKKKYGALSVLNQIIPKLAEDLVNQYGLERVHFCYGYETKMFRDMYGVSKDHYCDAYCIACMSLKDPTIKEPDRNDIFRIQQFRRHNRAKIHKQRPRCYYLDGKKVAENRRKRTGQTCNSLEEWRNEMIDQYGIQKAMELESRLRVKKSIPTKNTPDRLLPGTVFVYQGKRYVMSGQQNKGRYLKAVGEGDRRFSAKDCEIKLRDGGLRYL
jgi:hypothetical protein